MRGSTAWLRGQAIYGATSAHPAVLSTSSFITLAKLSGHICRAQQRPGRAAERAQLPGLPSTPSIIPGRGRHQLKCLRGVFMLCSINTSLGSSVLCRHVLSHFAEIIPSLCSSRSLPRLLQVCLSHIRPRSALHCPSFALAAWERGR